MVPVVVKLGGSLAEGGKLKSVAALVAQAVRPVAIVPGGGRLANAVRREQRRLDVDERVAHRMAILAMQQMALVIAAHSPRFVAAETAADFDAAFRRKRIAVWMPWRMAHAAAGLKQDWSLTSDSLAAWLAGEIGAKAVVLVKSCPVPAEASLAKLTETGVIDPSFASLVTARGLRATVLGAGDEARLVALLGGERAEEAAAKGASALPLSDKARARRRPKD